MWDVGSWHQLIGAPVGQRYKVVISAGMSLEIDRARWPNPGTWRTYHVLGTLISCAEDRGFEPMVESDQ